jgi:hypothetical protein
MCKFARTRISNTMCGLGRRAAAPSSRGACRSTEPRASTTGSETDGHPQLLAISPVRHLGGVARFPGRGERRLVGRTPLWLTLDPSSYS